MRFKLNAQIKRTLNGMAIGCGTAALALTIAAQLPRRGGTQVSSCASSPYSVYLVASNIHVDLVVPVENTAFDWRSVVKLETIGREGRGDYKYLKFGWGDRDFYMNTPSLDKTEFWRLMRTLFAPGNATAVHINGYGEIPIEVGNVTKCVGLSRVQYLKLVAYLRRSLRGGRADRSQAGFAAAAGFYEGEGFYSIANTCNNWVAGALDAADVTTPLWSGLPGPVMGKLGEEVIRGR